jgi:hypothetical protein
MRRSVGLSLLLLFGAPLLLAQDGPTTEAVSDTCAHPVSILWNDEPRDGTGALAVSVTDPKTGQQIPQLPGDAFSLSIDNKGKIGATIVEVSQSRDALARLANSPGGIRHTIESDPVSIDAFFAVDLSRSMEAPKPQQGGPARSNREIAVSLIQRITDDKSNPGRSLLGRGDRILVSGFDDQLHTDLMRDLTGDSAAVRPALAALLEYSPRSENTALFAAIERNLTLIERLAPSYSEMKRRREAVLFVITDSFNGRDLQARRNLSRCSQNDALAGSLVERIEAVRRATDEGLRVYILALGEEGEARGYSADSPAKRSCRPTNAQKNTVDGYNFRRLTDPALGDGGSITSTSEDAIFGFVQKEFQLRRQAYKISYQLPQGARSPSRYQVNVLRNGVTCSAAVRSSGDIVPTIAAGSDLETRPAEMALLLASLLISMLFVPRTITNLRASLKRDG